MELSTFDHYFLKGDYNAKWQIQIKPFVNKLTDKIKSDKIDKSLPEEILEYAFLLEEYRLQIFAQGQVKVVGKVSEKRLSGILLT